MLSLIHHYTSINTLALILRNKTIRFNRLDQVDDISEAERFNPYELSKFLFVTCWTIKKEEDIPQWYMYTEKLKGVRISFYKDDLFEFVYDRPKIISNHNFNGIGVKSAIPPEKEKTDNYFILGSNLRPNNSGNLVEYDKELPPNSNSLIERKKDSNLKLFTIKNEVFETTLKSKYWKFQKEFRFTLFLVPNRNPNLTNEDRIVSSIIESLENGIEPNIKYLDIDLSNKSFDRMKIVLGPMCNEADVEIVDHLVNNHAPNAKIQKSKLTGKIKV